MPLPPLSVSLTRSRISFHAARLPGRRRRGGASFSLSFHHLWLAARRPEAIFTPAMIEFYSWLRVLFCDCCFSWGRPRRQQFILLFINWRKCLIEAHKTWLALMNACIIIQGMFIKNWEVCWRSRFLLCRQYPEWVCPGKNTLQYARA